MLDLLHVAPTAFLIGMVKTLAVGVVGKLLRLPEVLKIPFDCTMGLRKNNALKVKAMAVGVVFARQVVVKAGFCVIIIAQSCNINTPSPR